MNISQYYEGIEDNKHNLSVWEIPVLSFIGTGNIKSMISFILTYIGVWPFRWYAFSTSKQ